MANYMYVDQDFIGRQNTVNIKNLPDKCCYKCKNWVSSESKMMDLETTFIGASTPKKEVSGFGLCTEACTSEWDSFTWADDVCSEYEKDEG